ncbi:hypothetical protein Tco_0760414, partial [Tanacetum coccineum]
DQHEEAELMKALEKETQIQEEPKRPLKWLRLRHQDDTPYINGTPLKKPKLEEIEALPYDISKSQSRALEGGLLHPNNKGKPISPQTSPCKMTPASDRPSHEVRIKEPKPKKIVLPLVKPKNNPLQMTQHRHMCLFRLLEQRTEFSCDSMVSYKLLETKIMPNGSTNGGQYSRHHKPFTLSTTYSEYAG